MRGMTSGDGKMSGNVQTIGSYDKSKSAKPEPEKGDGPMDGGNDEMKGIVAEHGPAHTHVIKKSEHGHSSETHHESGHIHHADHGSLQEAHEHGMAAMEQDGEHAPMSEDSEDRAGERDAMEVKPRSKTPSFMD